MILFFLTSIAPLSFPRNNLHLCLFQEIPLIILRCDFFSHSPFHLHIIQPQTQVGEVEDPSCRFKRPRFLGEHRCHILSQSVWSLLPYSIKINMITVAIFYHKVWSLLPYSITISMVIIMCHHIPSSKWQRNVAKQYVLGDYSFCHCWCHRPERHCHRRCRIQVAQKYIVAKQTSIFGSCTVFKNDFCC